MRKFYTGIDIAAAIGAAASVASAGYSIYQGSQQKKQSAVPLVDDGDAQAAEAEKERKAKARAAREAQSNARARRGRRSTLLTSPQGTQQGVNTQRTSLLGG